MKLWQLKRLSDGTPLNEPQTLPENWGVLFGMSHHTDRLSDVSWMGPEYADMGWFVVDELPEAKEATPEELAWENAKQMLRETDWTMLPDVPMSREKRKVWEEWRAFVREIRTHADWPRVVIPPQPE